MKYYEIVSKANFEPVSINKVCHLTDLFNGEDLAKDGKYMFNNDERWLRIERDFFFDTKDGAINDFQTFLGNCKDFYSENW